MGKKKFIDKKTAVTFQVVHRSQRDPLQADEDSSKRVLVPVGKDAGGAFADVSEYGDEDWEDDEGSEAPQPKGKGKSRATGSDADSNSAYMKKAEYAGYGIYYDDDYDYSQHLRPMGGAPDAVFVESTTAPKKITVGKGIELPADIFASDREDAIGLLNRAAPSSGPQLDLDPELLAAMEEAENADGAEADFGLDDDFVAMALEEGESGAQYDAGASHDVKAGKEEYMRSLGFGSAGKGGDGAEDEDNDDDAYEDVDSDEGESGEEEEGASDVLEELPRRKAFGGEETRSRFTEYSMTSSVMRRTQGLQLLDERFEQLMAEYDDEEIGPLDSEDPGVHGHTTDLARFDKLFDDYIEQTSVVKLEDAMRSVSAADRKRILDRQRARHAAAMKRAGVNTSSKTGSDVNGDAEGEEDGEDLSDGEGRERIVVGVKPAEKWDCESILSTYSNIYNHPKLISEPPSARKKAADTNANGDSHSQIRLSSKTGIPLGVLPTRDAKRGKDDSEDEDDGEEGSGSDEGAQENRGVARPKKETAEERRQRKQAIKAERKERRATKKATKEVFKKEELRQEHDNLARKANAAVKINL